MRHLFEVFLTSGENWMRSNIVMNARSKSRRQRSGRYVWKKYETLCAE